MAGPAPTARPSHKLKWLRTRFSGTRAMSPCRIAKYTFSADMDFKPYNGGTGDGSPGMTGGVKTTNSPVSNAQANLH
eukprot:4630485-Karenia_brevis.AAC.1